MNMMVIYMVFLSIFAVVYGNPSKPDCRKFIYLSVCRGVAAKRAHTVKPNELLIDPIKLKEILKTFDYDQDQQFEMEKQAGMAAIHSKRPNGGYSFGEDLLPFPYEYQ